MVDGNPFHPSLMLLLPVKYELSLSDAHHSDMFDVERAAVSTDKS